MLKRAADDAVVLHGYGDVTDDDFAQVAKMIAGKGGLKGRPRVNHAGELDEFDVMDALEVADRAGLRPKYRETGKLRIDQEGFRPVARAADDLLAVDWRHQQEREDRPMNGAATIAGAALGGPALVGAVYLLCSALGLDKGWAPFLGASSGVLGALVGGALGDSAADTLKERRRGAERDASKARLRQALSAYTAKHGPPEF